MPELSSVLNSINGRHHKALEWFHKNAGTEQGWPEPLSDGTLLVSKAKGIYKPKWMPFALSIREMLQSPYRDEAPIVGPDGRWTYKYFQENEKISERDREYTNRGLVACIDANVPVGVIRQSSPKPDSRYYILGLAMVVDWKAGFFKLEGLTYLPKRSI